MIFLKITKFCNSKILITLFLTLLISGCNNRNTVETQSDDSNGSTTNTGAINTSDVRLSWAAPSEREDNKPISLSEIAGYKIYYGTSQRSYSDNIKIDDGDVDSYTFYNMDAGTYYFALTTLDTAGRESQYSDEIKIVV